MCTAIGVTDLTPNLPTTMKKDGQVGKGLPIDHVIANKAALDCLTKVRIDYGRSMSDHLPLWIDLSSEVRPGMHVAWPQIPKNSLVPTNVVPWERVSYTYQEWVHNATVWLESTCQSTIPPPRKGPGTYSSIPQKFLRDLHTSLCCLGFSELLRMWCCTNLPPKGARQLSERSLAIKWRPWREMLSNMPQLHIEVMKEVQRHMDTAT